jgi:hypothetical protein
MIKIVFGYFAAGLVAGGAGLAFAAVVQGLPAVVRQSPRLWHRIGCVAFLAALLLPGIVVAFAGLSGGAAPIEIWNSRASVSPWPQLPAITVSPTTEVGDVVERVRLGQTMPIAVFVICAVGVALAMARLMWRRRGLRRVCRALPVIKRVGLVRICAGDDVQSPFAARVRGAAYIVVPTSLLGDGSRLRIVIAHEAQHHRQGDLRCAGWLAVLRALWFWNPAFRSWQSALVELEDLDCDQAAVRRSGVAPFDYARCLISVAESALPASLAVGVRSMAAPTARALGRRISALTRRPVRRNGLAAFAVFTLMVMISGGTWAVTGAVSDRRVHADEVAALASQIQQRSGFPVLASAPIVEALNRRVATPEARERTRAALARMVAYRGMIDEVLRAQGLPRELIAIPFQESGFDADAHTNRPLPVRSAGLWQLIPSTARTLGLEVSARQDDRLDPRRATEAAARLLRDNFARFGDWALAIAAYNTGSKLLATLTSGLDAAGAKNRILAASDHEYGRYLAGAMAALILIENPRLVE